MIKNFIPVIDIIGSLNFVITNNKFNYMVLKKKSFTLFVKEDFLGFYENNNLVILILDEGFVKIKNSHTNKYLKLNLSELTHYTNMFTDYFQDKTIPEILVSQTSLNIVMETLTVSDFCSKYFWQRNGFSELINKNKYFNKYFNNYIKFVVQYYLNEEAKLNLYNLYYDFLTILDINKTNRLKVENSKVEPLHYVFIVNKSQIIMQFRKKYKTNRVHINFNRFSLKLNGKEKELTYLPVVLDIIALISKDLVDEKVSLQFQDIGNINVI